ncbi:MAG: lysophospholipase [Marinilabiliales bacterium]|nr:lysophospholipase [Marinilabiliales bacterium]
MNYLVRRRPELTGAIATSSMASSHRNTCKGKVLMANLAKKLMPGLTQPSGLKTEWPVT